MPNTSCHMNQGAGMDITLKLVARSTNLNPCQISIMNQGAGMNGLAELLEVVRAQGQEAAQLMLQADGTFILS